MGDGDGRGGICGESAEDDGLEMAAICGGPGSPISLHGLPNSQMDTGAETAEGAGDALIGS